MNPNAENKSKMKRIIRPTTNIDLPEEILHPIFSFLPIKTLEQTTVLSKRWNQPCLWRSHPHLYFSCLTPESMELIPTVLSRRQPDSNITALRLSGYVTASCLRDCMDPVLMKHGIEQIELDVRLDLCFTLPPCLFGCKTLEALTLNCQNKVQNNFLADTCFKYLTPAGLPSVHTLSLTNVYFARGYDLFSGKNFPLLRKLWLKNCRGLTSLDIKCPGLEILQLDRLWLNWLDISGIGLLELRVTKCFRYLSCRANILAPSLQSLYWEGKVSLDFRVLESFRDLKTFSLWFYYKLPNRATLQSVSTLLSAICFVRSMTFVGSGSRVLETLSKIDFEGGLPCSFNNLITLELHTKMTKDEITGIICLLRSSPILRTITITANSCSNTGNEKWKEKQYWISQIEKLKSIEFHLKVARSNVRGSKMHKSAV